MSCTINGRLVARSAAKLAAANPPSLSIPYNALSPPPRNVVLRSYRHLLRACVTRIGDDPDTVLEIMGHIRSAYVTNLHMSDPAEITEAYKAALDGAFVLSNEIRFTNADARLKVDANSQEQTIKIDTPTDALYALWKENGGKLILPPGMKMEESIMQGIQESFAARRAVERKARKQRVGGADAEAECKKLIAQHQAEAAAEKEAAEKAKSTYSVPEWLAKAPQANKAPA